jgi:predicted enzyme related to lactoylglutathione lyase
MISYEPGTPSWVDLSSPDLDASARFYGQLLGWHAVESEGAPEQTGGYRMFTLGGAEVAGLAPAQPGQPAAWNTYVSVEDVEAAKQDIEAAGGTTVLGPLRMMDAGSMAVFRDGSEGAFFSAWQPDRHAGAQRINEPGALTMNELASRDLDGAARFYGAVFDWRLEKVEAEGSVQYAFFRLGERTIAGVLPMGDTFPPDAPSFWTPYFGSDDLDVSAETASSLGAQVLAGPTPVPNGRFVALKDPQGAIFSLWEGSYEPPAGE